MKIVVKCLVGLAVLAAPCAYDAYSTEPTLITAISTMLRTPNNSAAVPVEQLAIAPPASRL